MIIWGTTEKKIKEGKISQDTCPICESRTTMRYDVFGKYFHLFWIPTFPLKKKKILECTTCGEYLYINEFSKRFQDKFKIEASSRYPISFYSGLLMSTLLLSVLSILFFNRGLSDQNIIDNPAVGDVYTIKVDSPKEHVNDYTSHYTVLKATKITTDSITVMLNTKTTKKSYTYYLIDKTENYNPKLVKSFSKQELKSLYKTNYIKAVHRK